MLITRHWNFSRPAKITGHAVILGHDIVGDAQQVRKAGTGPLLLFLPRRPEVTELLRMPGEACLLVCESGDQTSGEFIAAVKHGIFYANNATGAIASIRSGQMKALDLLAAEVSDIQKFEAGLLAQVERLDTRGDAGNGMSERHNVLLDVGNQLSSAGRFVLADHAYRLADRLAPDHPAVLNNRGGNFVRWGRLAEAERAYRLCLQRDPEAAAAHKNLGDVLRQLGREEAAVEAYSQALRLRPGYAKAWYGLGIVHLVRRNATEAEACLRKAVYFDPVDPLAFVNLGAALLMQEKLSDALHAYEEARALRPDPGLDIQVAQIRARLEESPAR